MKKWEYDDCFEIGDTMYRIIEYRIQEGDNMLRGFRNPGCYLTLKWNGRFWTDAPVDLIIAGREAPKTFRIRAKVEKTFVVKADDQEAAFEVVRDRLDNDDWELDYMEEV